MASLFSGCDESADEDISALVLPRIPDTSGYDAIFAGENHVSAQIYDIELKLMKHYYGLGIRDFAFECSLGDALFLQYYLDSGDEECFNYITRQSAKGIISPINQGKVKFYRDIFEWYLTLEEKIKIHGFDVEHIPHSTGKAALWFFVIRRYRDAEDGPASIFGWNYQSIIEDFRNNSQRYSEIEPEDMELLEKLVSSMEQGEIVNKFESRLSKRENYLRSAVNREKFMIENFREIKKETGGKKIFAIMGYYHAALTGNAPFIFNERQFPSLFTDHPSLANVLKTETRIASIVLRTFKNEKKWPYFIKIKGWKTSKPYKSMFRSDWPYS